MVASKKNISCAPAFQTRLPGGGFHAALQPTLRLSPTLRPPTAEAELLNIFLQSLPKLGERNEAVPLHQFL